MNKSEIVKSFFDNATRLLNLYKEIENFLKIENDIEKIVSFLEEKKQETDIIEDEINKLRSESEKFCKDIPQNEKLNSKYLDKIHSKFQKIIKGFTYWYKHYTAYQKIAIKYKCWKVRFLLHDIEKPFLNIFMSYENVHRIHRHISPHHVESFRKKKDYLGMLIDWECARYTKPKMPLNAKETCDKFYPEVKDKIYPLLKKHGLMEFVKTYESFNSPITIAVTGSIASGKSTVCSSIEKDYGYLVYYSDIEAKNLANNNNELKNDIIKEFGEESYLGGVYNTKYIASIVFNDKNELEKLNRIFRIHLRNDWKNFINQHKNEKFIFYESALIFEHNLVKEYDYVICVYASLDTIRKRLKSRNNYNDVEIENRLSKLSNQEYKIKNSDFSINTDFDWKDQLDEIMRKL
jgi:dephospho-CoA kinase